MEDLWNPFWMVVWGSIGQMGFPIIADAAELTSPSFNNLVYSLFAGFTVLVIAGGFLLITGRK